METEFGITLSSITKQNRIRLLSVELQTEFILMAKFIEGQYELPDAVMYLIHSITYEIVLGDLLITFDKDTTLQYDFKQK